jgi:hypothetical protein
MDGKTAGVEVSEEGERKTESEEETDGGKEWLKEEPEEGSEQTAVLALRKKDNRQALRARTIKT